MDGRRYAPLFFTNYCFDVKWTSWRVITYAFVGYGLHAVATILFFCAYMMDRYIIYHSRTNRVIANPRLGPGDTATAAGVVNAAGLDYRRIEHYRRSVRADDDAFDYRREFYMRADRNYRVAGIYGNGGVAHTASSDSNSSNTQTAARESYLRDQGPAARSRDAAQRQQEQRERLSNNATGRRSGRRQQRQRPQQAQQQPLLSPVRSTQNSDL